MMRVAHLLDDAALGGVNRMLDALIPLLDEGYIHSRHLVTPHKGWAPALQSDVVVIHFTLSWRKLAWLAQLRRRNSKAVLVLVEHSYTERFEALYVPHYGRFRAMLRIGYGFVDRIVSVSTAKAGWITAAIHPAVGKLVVINPFTDLSKLRALPLRARLPGPLRLCGFGRFAPQKGFDILIDAMRWVHPDIATLRLVGLGPDEPSLRARADGLPHVIIEGPVDGPAGLFCTIDALAIPSRFEPYGCVGAEARAAGLPMIVSNADGLRDQFVAAEALRVPPENPDALAAAIIWLAGQDMAPMARAARGSAEGAEEQATAAWQSMLQGSLRAGRMVAA